MYIIFVGEEVKIRDETQDRGLSGYIQKSQSKNMRLGWSWSRISGNIFVGTQNRYVRNGLLTVFYSGNPTLQHGLC